MVDRYKKSGGFVQLVQVIETCNSKKREQFMNIISEESPEWAEAITQKSISFSKIISWKPEVILEITASVNPLAFAAAVRSLTPEQREELLQKLSNQERRKLEQALSEGTPSPGEIASSVMKVITETRALMIQGALKVDRIDPDLVIPDDFEAKLSKPVKNEGMNLIFEAPPTVNVASGTSATGPSQGEVEKPQKRLVLLSKEVQTLKFENQLMKDKLEKIKKIA